MDKEQKETLNRSDKEFKKIEDYLAFRLSKKASVYLGIPIMIIAICFIIWGYTEFSSIKAKAVEQAAQIDSAKSYLRLMLNELQGDVSTVHSSIQQAEENIMDSKVLRNDLTTSFHSLNKDLFQLFLEQQNKSAKDINQQMIALTILQERVSGELKKLGDAERLTVDMSTKIASANDSLQKLYTFFYNVAKDFKEFGGKEAVILSNYNTQPFREYSKLLREDISLVKQGTIKIGDVTFDYKTNKPKDYGNFIITVQEFKVKSKDDKWIFVQANIEDKSNP